MTASSEIKLSPAQRNDLHQKLRDLFISLRANVDHTLSSRTMDKEAKDKILSYGERLSARLLEAKCLQEGIQANAIDAFDIIETDDNFGEARPDFGNTKIKAIHRINPLLNRGVVPIVTGFIGATKDGRITTLGRGGSDYSASILGWALNAQEIWIWTDVDGVFTGDPNKDPDARLIEKMRFDPANTPPIIIAEKLNAPHWRNTNVYTNLPISNIGDYEKVIGTDYAYGNPNESGMVIPQSFRTLVQRNEIYPSPNFKVLILGRDAAHCRQITETLTGRGIRFNP